MKWFEIGTTSHLGYPQPEGSYAEFVYETNGYCKTCGMVGRQKAPFSFRSEPKSHRSHFIQLNWVFDEIFIRPQVRTIFESESISGITYGVALHHKSNKALIELEQLKIETVIGPGLLNDDLSIVTCKPDNEEPYLPSIRKNEPHCGRVKYHFPKEGLTMNRFSLEKAPDFVKTSEWFGSGGRAFKAILISERVAEIIKRHSLRGIYLNEVRLR